MSPWRPDFVAGLELFGKVSAEMQRRGFSRPEPVGGAAVEIYSGGIVATGDFDIVVARDDMLEQIFVEHGFERPQGAGVATRGWVYRELRLGFEIVDTVLLDGAADRSRVRMFSTAADDDIEIISVEDLIADRMGQYASGTAPDMLGQAQTLFDLYSEADMDYLERRIREETLNEHGIATLRSRPQGHDARSIRARIDVPPRRARQSRTAAQCWHQPHRQQARAARRDRGSRRALVNPAIRITFTEPTPIPRIRD